MCTEKSNGGPFVTFREECEILQGRIAELEVDNKKAWGTGGEMAERLAAVLNERNELAAAVEQYKKILDGWVSLAENANIESGICCCGDNMEGHANPMSCGHSPTDSGAYYCEKLHEQSKVLTLPSPDLLAKRDQRRDASLLRKLSETFRKKENWGIDPFHYLLRLASECESGEWKPDLEVK